VVLGANGTCVHFDVPQVVACRPASTTSWSGESNQQQLVEAAFDVSALLRFGRESDVQQLLFVIESPTGSLRVADYFPKTELRSLYVGQIERSRQQEASDSAGLNASFAPSEYLNAQASASQAGKVSESIRYQTAAPLELLASSGTASRGTAVYFKFRSTPQSTLDGSHRVRVRFAAPSGWRADYVYLRCAAYSRSSAPSQGAICGSSDFLVPLYRDGDDVAREAAERLAAAELALRQLARQFRGELQRSTGSSFTERFVMSLRGDDKQPLPETWLSQVLSSDPQQREFSFQERLPEPLERAVTEFTSARWQLVAMSP
jgi:hypothetical protein